MSETKPGLCQERGSGQWAPARSTGWSSSTGFLAALVDLRHGTTHDVLASWFGVDRSTITGAIGEVHPLFAGRSCAVTAGVRLRTLADVVDYLGANEEIGIVDDTEIRVRLPDACPGRKNRAKFIAGRASRTPSRPRCSDGNG